MLYQPNQNYQLIKTGHHYLRDTQGNLIAKQRLETGVFSPWKKVKFSQEQTNDGATIWHIESTQLNQLELAELDRLPMLWWGMLLSDAQLGTWSLLQYRYCSTPGVNSGFTAALGQTGV